MKKKELELIVDKINKVYDKAIEVEDNGNSKEGYWNRGYAKGLHDAIVMLGATTSEDDYGNYILSKFF